MSTRLFDFGDGNGPVPAHRHRNPDGSIGGGVADTAFVAESVYVGSEACILEKHVFLSTLSLRTAQEYQEKRWYPGMPGLRMMLKFIEV